jgi:hypothetical protein
VRSYERACLGDEVHAGQQGPAARRDPSPSPVQDGSWLGRMSPRPPGPGDLPRGCLALAVAYDRAGLQAQAALLLRRAALMDPVGRALKGRDFVPAADLDYYRALWLLRRGDACGARSAVLAYLSAARDLAPGRAYLASARAHLEALGVQCKEGYSSTDSTKRSERRP